MKTENLLPKPRDMNFNAANAEGNPTNGDEITVSQLFKNFQYYCVPKKNLVVEKRKFFWKNHEDDETFDQYRK